MVNGQIYPFDSATGESTPTKIGKCQNQGLIYCFLDCLDLK